MAYETKDTAYLIVIAIIVIAFLLTVNSKSTDTGFRVINGDSYNDGDIKCELQDNTGRTITITGSGPEFERMCRQRNINLYNTYWTPLYYYTWYRPWGWRRHGGHHGGNNGGTNGGTNGGSGSTNGGAGSNGTT